MMDIMTFLTLMTIGCVISFVLGFFVGKDVGGWLMKRKLGLGL